MKLSKKILTTCFLLYLVSQILFLINIQFPRGQDFDEFHYVPSAKQFLAMTDNQNWEHPPLGKEIMAVSIGLFGDRPIGWRFMSTVFGALTLVGMFLWGLALFQNYNVALYAALLTFFNQLLYVQSRIGMLDTFMFAFITWGMAAFFAAWNTEDNPSRTFKLSAFAGLMFGLAAACKWMAVVPWFFCLALLGFVRLFQSWDVTFSSESPWKRTQPDFSEWYSPKILRDLRIWQVAACFVLIPLAAYFATFLPFLFVNRAPGVPSYGLWDLVLMQPKMWDGQLRVVTAHPYMSNWPSWPLMLRPIWYAFDKEGSDYVRGVILLGNPLIMWGGLLAVLACFWAWIARRSRPAFLIAATYAAFLLCWAAIPRKVAFYYYYYPAGMVLSFAIAWVFHTWERGEQFAKFHWARWIFLAGCVGMFFYFFPILSAIRINATSFRNWMWLSSWI